MVRQAPKLLPRRLAGVALLALVVAGAPAAFGAGTPAPREQALRDRDRALEAQSRAAVLDLYALETKLTRARGRLAAIERRADRLRHERAVVVTELRVARDGVRITQRRLAERLRALYEQDEADPLAIVLGSRSLDAALTGIENLGQMARGDRQVLAAVRRARSGLVVLQRRLADRQQRIDALAGAAAATAHSLEAARSGRVAYIASLESQRRLTRAAIARLQGEARAAQAKSRSLQPRMASQPVLETVAASPAPIGATGAAPSSAAGETRSEAAGGERTLTVVATGYALPGRTATGLPVGWGVAAVDPSVVPLGTQFDVPGYGSAVAADVGGSVHGATIDLWFPSVAEAHAWGRRVVTITLR